MNKDGTVSIGTLGFTKKKKKPLKAISTKIKPIDNILIKDDNRHKKQ